MAAEPDTLRILIVRPDRLGDVVLSTPVLDVIKRNYPQSRLTLLVREAVVPVVEGLPSVDEILVYRPEGAHAGLGGIWRLAGEIRQRKFRIAVVLQAGWRVALAVFLAGVRYRVGPLSKLHSYFLYNRGARQRRSQVEMHEADYNLQLLRKLGIRVGTRHVPTSVALAPGAAGRAAEWLRERGFQPGAPLVVVHPGMGGSALNWPESHYVELLRALVREGRSVLVTSGPAETALVGRLAAALGTAAERIIVYSGSATAESLGMLGGLLSHASVVVAPSTGPLHVAVALGKPVVTFFPPIRVQSAIRWGPYVKDERAASVLVPEVYCGEDFACRGNLCNYFPCMRTLTVNEALEKVNLMLARALEHAAAPAAAPAREPAGGAGGVPA
jgi:heptosyltransferase III